MGGLFGGGAPQAATSTTPGTGQIYTPQAQPAMDVAYQNILNPLISSSIAGIPSQLPSQQIYPEVQNIAQTQIQPGQLPGTYGPYSTQAMQAALQAAQIGQNTLGAVSPYIPQLPGLGQAAAATTTGSIPALQGMLGNIPGMGQQLYQTAFDPQQALYNRTAQQVRDQANAINYASGVGTSPYGAGVAGQTMSNFNIDWQNQLLNRMLQGTLGYGSLAQAAGGLGTNIGNLAGLGLNQNIQGLQSALGLGGASAQLAQQAGMLPYQTAVGMGQNALNALQTQQLMGNQQYTIPQLVLNDLQSYLGLGQSASNIAGQLGSLASQQAASNMAGLGMLAGPASNLLFGSQGLSGALGLGSGGLLGGLFGGGAGAGAGAGLTAADLSGVGAAMSGAGAAGAADAGGKGLGTLALAA
jgi:hypothetical protein